MSECPGGWLRACRFLFLIVCVSWMLAHYLLLYAKRCTLSSTCPLNHVILQYGVLEKGKIRASRDIAITGDFLGCFGGKSIRVYPYIVLKTGVLF